MVENTETTDEGAAGGLDTDEDRYPTLTEALEALQDYVAHGDRRVDRLQLTCLANGEVNCKWWSPRAEEPEFVFIPAAEGRPGPE